MRTKIFACIWAISLLLLFPLQVHAEDVQGMLDGILQYQLSANDADSVQDWIDGELSQNAGMTSEWYILALTQQGEYDFSAYAQALSDYLAENTVTSASTRLKITLAQRSIGESVEIPADSIGAQGIMSEIFGLHLLHNGCVSDTHTEESLVDAILSAQLPDGGWAVSGTVSDPDVTAMALQVLAPHAEEHSEAVDRALTRLSDLQQEDGGYVSYGVKNPESAAQVLTALITLEIDPLTDERFLKNGNSLIDSMAGYRLSDGSFSHTMGGASNYNATMQVFFALTAFSTGQNPYLFAERTVPAPAIGYKVPVILVISGIGILTCIVMLCRKKRIKAILPVIVMTAAAAVFVGVTDFQSAEDYYQPDSPESAETIGTVTITIRCDTVAGKAAHIPENGVILEETEIPIHTGDTVFDVLTAAARTHAIHMEYNGTPELAYLSGIGNLYEFDFGDLSGWVYHVNGASSSTGCGEYPVTDGDAIEWLYSCDLGEDVR